MDDQRYSCAHVVPIEQEPRHHLVIENEFVRAFAVEIAPHDRTLCHHHPHDYLLYVAGDADIISAARDEEPKKLSYRDGECELLEAGLVHVVENLGETAFRNVVVELLPGARSLRRGDGPKVMRAEGDEQPIFAETKVTLLFEHDRVAILSIQIDPGAEVEIFGPAVVATPYGNRLGPDAFEGVEIKSNYICDLAMIPPQREASLWGCWQEAEPVIVFQIGRIEDQGLAVLKARDPLKSLHAHADETE